MRIEIAFTLLAALTLTACSDDPPPPPERPPQQARPERHPDMLPALPSVDDPSLEPESPPEEPEAVAAEPTEWARIELELEDPPEVVLVSKDVSVTRLSVAFEKTPMLQAVDHIVAQTGVTITQHVDLRECFTAEELAVTLRAESAPLGDILDRLCAPRRIAWWVAADGVHIAVQKPLDPVTKTYPLGDLPKRGSDTGSDALADRIRENIDPVVWDASGEVGIGEKGATLIVTAPKSTQKKVLALLRELRAKAE
jgi:hypothetical protein